MNEKKILGVYASPDAVVAQPDYARRLVGEAGVNQFVLRAGFDPANANPVLGKATEILRGLEVDVLFLAGTWWGGTEGPAVPGAHESRFPATMPGSDTDDLICRSLETMCTAAKPDGVCVTHSRYRHPAYIDGVFDVGDAVYQKQMAAFGVEPDALKSAVDAFFARLSGLPAGKVQALSASRDLIAFLDAVAGTTAFADFFRFRCAGIETAMKRFRETVLAAGAKRFGSNAYSPIAARLCGQDYAALGNVFDFIQPLLGYMRWHVLQPVVAWAEQFGRRGGMDPKQAALLSARLFRLETAMPPEAVVPGEDEGSSCLVRDVVTRELELVAKAGLRCAASPVLRGKDDWERAVTDELRRRSDAGFAGTVFQGCGYLVAPATHPGWN